MSVILTQSCSHVYQEHLFMPSKKPYNYKKLKQKKKKKGWVKIEQKFSLSALEKKIKHETYPHPFPFIFNNN